MTDRELMADAEKQLAEALARLLVAEYQRRYVTTSVDAAQHALSSIGAPQRTRTPMERAG